MDKQNETSEITHKEAEELSAVLSAAANYIELLEKMLSAYRHPTRFSGYLAPSDSDLARANGKWCAAKAIAELGR